MTDSPYTVLRLALARKPEELTFSDNSYYNEDFMESSTRTEFAGWYDHDTVAEQVGFILDHCQLQEGATALDVACGHGHHSELLHASGLKVVATDISEPLISYLKAKYAGVELEYVVADFSAYHEGGILHYFSRDFYGRQGFVERNDSGSMVKLL